MNAFGDIIQEYTSPASGYVNTIASDPLREPGATLVKVILDNTDPKCKDGCWDGE